MSLMFYKMYGLTSLNLSNFDNSKVTDMGSMFRGMTGLTNLDFRNAIFDNGISTTNMFYDVNINVKIYTKNAATKAILEGLVPAGVIKTNIIAVS